MQALYTASAVVPAGAWDVFSLIKNATKSAQGIIGLLVILGGTVLIGMGAWMAIKKIGGNQQTAASVSAPKMILAFLVGGAFMGGGWKILADISSGGQKTINDLGNGTAGSMLTSMLGR